MKTHKKVYLAHFNYSEGEYIPCEVTGLPAVDVHHLSPRGMGGSNQKDNIENLMALTRPIHDFVENNPKWKYYFIAIHYQYLATRQPHLEQNDQMLKDAIKKYLGV